MASVVIEVAIDIIEDIVADLAAEAIISEEIAAQVVEEEFLQQVSTSMQTVLDGGGTDNQAALAAYDQLNTVDANFANAWANNMIEQGYDLYGGVDEQAADILEGSQNANESGGAFGDGTVDADDFEADDTAEEVEAKNVRWASRFWQGLQRGGRVLRWLWGAIGTIAIVLTVLFVIIGDYLIRGLCNIWCSIRQVWASIFSKTSLVHCAKGTSTWSCCEKTKCNNPTCDRAKNWRKIICQYKIPVCVIILIIGILLPIALRPFRSVFWILFIVILTLLVYFGCGILGYLIVRAICAGSDLTRIPQYFF